MTASPNEPIVWIDCEMTGLDVDRDALVEVAVVVTDSQLNPLDEGIDVLIAPPQDALDGMVELVRKMHTDSGLLTDLAHGVSMEEAQDLVMRYIHKHVPRRRRVPLAGNSVGTDRVFLERNMPRVTDHLHYRVIDVSSIKELARRWYPRAYFNSPAKNGGHRALADILESIDELRYYRAVLFPQGEGPTTEEARRAAAEIAAARGGVSAETPLSGESPATASSVPTPTSPDEG